MNNTIINSHLLSKLISLLLLEDESVFFKHPSIFILHLIYPETQYVVKIKTYTFITLISMNFFYVRNNMSNLNICDMCILP